MDKHYQAAELSAENINDINGLQKKLNEQIDNNIVLVAYEVTNAEK